MHQNINRSKKWTSASCTTFLAVHVEVIAAGGRGRGGHDAVRAAHLPARVLAALQAQGQDGPQAGRGHRDGARRLDHLDLLRQPAGASVKVRRHKKRVNSLKTNIDIALDLHCH